jgi:acyl carrier protein
METQTELAECVLGCANRIANKSLTLPPDGDLPLGAFNFDSLSLFAYILELERTCGITFDSILLNQERLDSIRSTAALIAETEPGNATQSI